MNISYGPIELVLVHYPCGNGQLRQTGWCTIHSTVLPEYECLKCGEARLDASNPDSVGPRRGKTQYKITMDVAMRSGPGTLYSGIRKLPYGSIVQAEDTGMFDWEQVSDEHGIIGWVPSTYLKRVE